MPHWHHHGPDRRPEQRLTRLTPPPGDPAALAGALEEALAMDVGARMALGHRARRSVLDGYTVRAMQDATLDVYEAVARGRAG